MKCERRRFINLNQRIRNQGFCFCFFCFVPDFLVAFFQSFLARQGIIQKEVALKAEAAGCNLDVEPC